MNTSFSKVARQILKERDKEIQLMDIISFAESKAGLGVKLYPVQKMILKLFYKLPLTDSLPEGEHIVIKDEFNEHIIHEFASEYAFIEFLRSEKRINISIEDYQDPDNVFSECVLICGRRASKTTLTAIITCYSIYQLLSIPDPHEYYGVLRTDPIGITFVSNIKAGAYRTFKAVTDLITNSKFFTRYTYDKGAVANELWLKTDSFRQEEELGVMHTNPGNIVISSQTAGPSVRGASNFIIAIDEIAHFRDADTRIQKDKYLDQIVYEALYPSILGFVDPVTHKGVGKSFVISSPKGEDNLLYEMYQESFNQKNVIMLNTPSNWINEKISPQDLRKLYQRSEASFRQEIRAEFVEAENKWIPEPERLKACFDIASKNLPYQTINTTYFSGLDLGLTGDWTAFAVGHYQHHLPPTYTPEREEFRELMAKDDNTQGVVVIDYIKFWKPPEKGSTDIELILSDLERIYQRFNIRTGTYDQYSAAIFTQLLKKRPKIRLEYDPATVPGNSNRALLMKSLINEGRLVMPYIEEVRDQFLKLNETVLREGMVKVDNVRGHDDIYSAISRAVEKIIQYGELYTMGMSYKVDGFSPTSIINKSSSYNLSNNASRNKMLAGKAYR